MTGQSIPEYLNELNQDQLFKIVELANERLEKRKLAKKKIVWQVCDAWLVHENFREEDYEKAVDKLIEVLKDGFMKEAPYFIENRYRSYDFINEVPHIEPKYINEEDYYRVYFPEDIKQEENNG